MSEKPKIVFQRGIAVLRTEFITEDKLRSSVHKFLETRTNGIPIIGAEIGVYEAINALWMLSLIPDLKLYLIDDYTNMTSYTGGPIVPKGFSERIKGIAEWNLARYNGRKVVIDKPSLIAADEFDKNFFDYVYIDGDHEYDAVKKDLVAWYPKVKVGGMLAGHDYGMHEVSSAVTEFKNSNGIPDERFGFDKFENTVGKSDWWITK